MTEQTTHNRVGVIGAGSFGTAIANLLAFNVDVYLYSRKPDLVQQINTTHQHLGVELSPRIEATSDMEALANNCTLLFPIIPSVNFRSMVQELAPFLRPYHILIHGTKGLDLFGVEDEELGNRPITRKEIYTMSEVITQETVVLRVGCLSGPNLAKEIMEGQPTATVIGSKFNEVIDLGKKVLKSQHFHVFGNHDILGAELSGALKNVIAIGSGILGGVGLGKNIQAMLITRGLTEMIYFGKAMGTSSKAFFGTAGIGDLVATATSKDSRNYTFGYRVGLGEKVGDVMQSMPELAEGVRTLNITYQLSKYYKLHVPITEMLYNVIFNDFSIEKAISFLMSYPYDVDVDFL